MRKTKSIDTSIGSLLIKLEFISESELIHMLEKQKMYKKRASEELLIGRILVSEGVITEDQLQEAIVLQDRLRCKTKYENSMAIAELAIQSKKRTQEKIVATTKKITDEYPSIVPNEK
jgi:hypothetical protein